MILKFIIYFLSHLDFMILFDYIMHIFRFIRFLFSVLGTELMSLHMSGNAWPLCYVPNPVMGFLISGVISSYDLPYPVLEFSLDIQINNIIIHT